MSKKHLSPVELTCKRFGSAREVARVLGLDHSTVVRTRHNASGLWKSEHIAPLVAEAKKRGIALTLEEMIYGGVV